MLGPNILTRISNLCCRPKRHAFTLLEVLIALMVLTFGLLSLLSILQKTLRASEPIEFQTRAALLAQSVLEGIRSDPGAFPFLPGVNPGTWPVIEGAGTTPDDSRNSIYRRGDPVLLDENGDPFDLNRTTQPSSHSGVPHRLSLPWVFSVPGNGVDDDSLLDDSGRWIDVTGPNGAPDGVDDQMGIFFQNLFGRPPGLISKRDYDGNIQKDVNEHLLGGISAQQLFQNSRPPHDDSDGDGLPFDTGDASFADDSIAQSVRSTLGVFPDGDLSYDPQRGIDEEFANGRDDDGDGLIDEDLTLPSQYETTQYQPFPNPVNLDPRFIPYNYSPTLAGNGLDDDGDQLVDEETWDTEDNDNDGQVDEDCKGTLFPYNPMPFPYPNEEFSFQLSVRRVPVAGDGIDNDSDGRLRGNNSFDDDYDGTTDEPDEGIDEEFANSWDDDGDGFADEDLRPFPASSSILVTLFIYQGDDRQDNDGDGWIDEEYLDGLDNDLDGLVDEDYFRRVIRTTGLVRVQ